MTEEINKKRKWKKPEFLLPAGSLEVLKAAVNYGADAVYVGGEVFSLRAKAKNFSREDMEAGVAYAHAHSVKVHVTANILAHNGDLKEAERYFEEWAVSKSQIPAGRPMERGSNVQIGMPFFY